MQNTFLILYQVLGWTSKLLKVEIVNMWLLYIFQTEYIYFMAQFNEGKSSANQLNLIKKSHTHNTKNFKKPTLSK
jgi:hypothetical protein